MISRMESAPQSEGKKMSHSQIETPKEPRRIHKRNCLPSHAAIQDCPAPDLGAGHVNNIDAYGSLCKSGLRRQVTFASTVVSA